MKSTKCTRPLHRPYVHVIGALYELVGDVWYGVESIVAIAASLVSRGECEP